MGMTVPGDILEKCHKIRATRLSLEQQNELDDARAMHFSAKRLKSEGKHQGMLVKT